MARRNRNIWEQIRESTEGPTVTVALPREYAEQLMQSLMQSLEMDDMGGEDDLDLGMTPGDDDGDEPMPDDDMGELDFDGGDEMPAGDDDDEFDEPSPPKKKGPPEKSKPKKDDKKKSDDDDEDDDKKDEASDYGSSGGHANGMRPQTALGESFRRLAGYIPRQRKR